MKPLKAIIVEDNVFMAIVLNEMLDHYKTDISIIDVVHSGNDALEKIAFLKPDVLFLDIELPDMTGFELLQNLEDIHFKTIFTTAHSHYAIKAFRFNALDYLIKPIDEKELEEAIKKLMDSSDNGIHMKNALTNLQSQTVENLKLVLPQQSGTLRIYLKHITHIEGERNYSYIHLSNGGRELSSKNLAYFDDILVDKNFFRSHRSHLINKYHIEALKDENFVLKSGKEVPISRRKKAEADAWFYK